MFANLLDIGDEIPSGIAFEVGMRSALAAAALVEQHDAITRWIKESTHACVSATTRATVQKYDWLTSRVTTFFPVDLVHVRDSQHAAAVRLERGIQSSQSCAHHNTSRKALEGEIIGPSGVPPTRWTCR